MLLPACFMNVTSLSLSVGSFLTSVACHNFSCFYQNFALEDDYGHIVLMWCLL